MSYHCPSCQRVLYDRRRKTCGFCGAELPPELLFTPEQVENLRKEAEAAELRKEEQAKADAKDKAWRDGLIGPSDYRPGD